MATSISDHTHPKIIEITFSFPEFVPECKKEKKSVHSVYSFLRYNQLQSPMTFKNMYQHAENQAISLICSGDMVDYKILQSDLLRTFWSIFQEQKSSQIWDLCRNTANNMFSN